MLFRAEHAWLVWRCKITLCYRTFKAPLLSPLKFSMENQKPNSRIPGWSVKLRLIKSQCVCVGCVCVWKRQRRWKGKIRSRTKEKLPVFLNHNFGVTIQINEEWRGRKSLDVSGSIIAMKVINDFFYIVVTLHPFRTGRAWDVPPELTNKTNRTKQSLFLNRPSEHWLKSLSWC